MPSYPLHLPIAHIDVQRICHNFNVLKELSSPVQADITQSFAMAPLPLLFGNNHAKGFIWPSQLAVIKADAYGHGQEEVAKALLANGVQMFASGSVQECAQLRLCVNSDSVILSLLGPITDQDIDLCAQLGIIPIIHSLDQMKLLSCAQTPLPIAIKCNTGMARLGFDIHELDEAINYIKKLPNIMPVLALSHLHSADSTDVLAQIKSQGTQFASMLKTLRITWPNIAASLANSAGTIFAEEIKKHIGPHICRPGISLYGSNPHYKTEYATKIKKLLPAMWISTPILSTRKLLNGQGIGYGHSFIAAKDSHIAILACGYADGFSRGLTHKASVCINGKKVPLVGRVAMQMIAADISCLQHEKATQAWLLEGPYSECINIEELACNWGTITYEVLCLLGNNVRNYINFNHM